MLILLTKLAKALKNEQANETGAQLVGILIINIDNVILMGIT